MNITAKLNPLKVTLFWCVENLTAAKFFKIFKNFITFQYVYFPEFCFPVVLTLKKGALIFVYKYKILLK